MTGIVGQGMTKGPQTLRAVLEAGTAHLQKRGIDHPRLACECLASRLLHCKRLDLYLQFDRELSDKQRDAMRRGILRAAAGEPVQYICGEWDFMGHTFRVDRRALIPRPETEILVEHVLACAALWEAPPVILDVGTGSGCIAISLALARPNAVYLAFDISEEALSLARENADRLHVSDRVVFATGDLSDLVEPGTLDALVGNLPYIRADDYARLDPVVREHEPRTALDGGPDGLAIIRETIQDAACMLKPEGRLFLEIGADQAGAVSGLCREAGFGNVNVSQDLAGRDRVVSAQLCL